MKIKIRVRDDHREWDEEYSPSTNDAEKWAANLISNFNGALRPGETARVVLSVTVLDEEYSEIEHDWTKRTDGMSVRTRGGRIVDIMFCGRCGITGKRDGLSPSVMRDSRFRAKKYQYCRV